MGEGGGRISTIRPTSCKTQGAPLCPQNRICSFFQDCCLKHSKLLVTVLYSLVSQSKSRLKQFVNFDAKRWNAPHRKGFINFTYNTFSHFCECSKPFVCSICRGFQSSEWETAAVILLIKLNKFDTRSMLFNFLSTEYKRACLSLKAGFCFWFQ